MWRNEWYHKSGRSRFIAVYGFVFKELALQTLILNEFLSLLFFVNCVTIHFAHSRNHFAQLDFMGVPPGIVSRGDLITQLLNGLDAPFDDLNELALI